MEGRGAPRRADAEQAGVLVDECHEERVDEEVQAADGAQRQSMSGRRARKSEATGECPQPPPYQAKMARQRPCPKA